MAEPAESSRRDFLSGQAARREVLRAGERVGDAILNGLPPVPVAHDTVRLETRAMACPWCAIMNPGPPRQVMCASDALNLVHEVEAKLTVYRDDSTIARVNRTAADGPVAVDDDLFPFLQFCRRLWEQTEGAFDVASGRLIRLWRDCRREGRVPGGAEVSSALEQVGTDKLVLDEGEKTVRFSRPVQLDFGAVGKGFAIDKAANHLAAEGVEDFLIHGGHSSLLGRGDHAGQGGWPVGLRNPLFVERPFATILLKNQALSSSGSNVQFFRHGGKRYGHILDPRRGWPAEGLLSATVVAADATTADALSTAFYVMGLDKAQQYCDDHPEVGAILIPAPDRSRDLSPIVKNIPDDCLFDLSE